MFDESYRQNIGENIFTPLTDKKIIIYKVVLQTDNKMQLKIGKMDDKKRKYKW